MKTPSENIWKLFEDHLFALGLVASGNKQLRHNKLIMQCMLLMTSQLWIFKARSILGVFVVTKLKLVQAGVPYLPGSLEMMKLINVSKTLKH